MNCCDYHCTQGANCPARNDTTRTYPRTLAQAFPHAPDPTFEVEVSDWGWTAFTYFVGFFAGFALAVLMGAM